MLTQGAIVRFDEVEVGSSFWEPAGNLWYPSHKIDATNARYQTHCGLVYGRPYTPPPDAKVKVYP